MDKPVFYDASGRRDRWTKRAFFALVLGVLITAVVFAATVAEVPTPPSLEQTLERPQGHPLRQQLARIRHHTGKGLNRLGDWLPGGDAAAAPAQLSVGFYAPWDDASRASLVRHMDQLDWLVPALWSVTGTDHAWHEEKDPRLDALLATAARRPRVLPMLQNADGDRWDGQGLAALLASPAARTALLNRLDAELDARKADGVVLDFEEVPRGAQRDYLAFLKQAHALLSARKRELVIAAPVGDSDWNLPAYAAVVDRLVLMTYDEHYASGEPGPVASQGWFVAQLKAAMARLPRDKVIVGIGGYAYDWHGGTGADSLSVEEAWLAARDSDTPVRFDRDSGNATFAYEEDGVAHIVWMLDAASAWNQLKAARAERVAGVALWRLGSEDDGYWSALQAVRDGRPAPNLAHLNTVGNVDVEGDGELLDIRDTPTVGARRITQDPRGLIVDEQYDRLPTPYVVRKFGARPGLVALTFDDGPDPEWTPRILDVLKQKNVPATFFVIGENAMGHPLLLKRIVDQGSELGSHTFTHPNLANVSRDGTRFELNATQRVVEAYTGRSLRLFRAPYSGDAEPTTTDELRPALTAQQAGYTNVGLHVDPLDWQRPGVEAIVTAALSQVAAGVPGSSGEGQSGADQSAQVILLHDGGGDRAQTLAALPRIIDGLRARGYRFVPVSTLAGLARDQVMPTVAGADLLSVRADVGGFLLLAGARAVLAWMFFAVIALGIGRALVLAALAIDGARNRPVPPPIAGDAVVSVLIPAFNEAKVINSSIARVLASEAVAVQVIVIDDGSTDGTSNVVGAAWSGDPRVRLLTLENGGKARALNRGLALATADIVIALDADTQFEPLTIARLARWFADPAIGAVAGNAKVGNRVNLPTRWQAVEYVTAQNLERRALARFDAIMVVPGAVGAWRRAALDAVGGYPTDTLAEDQDLTIAIQRQGWRVTYDVDAAAWTEAPESFRSLAKQRFRWAFGTLQCLWKHRGVLKTGQPRGLAWVGIPQAWAFQIGFAVVSPLIDLALVVSIVTTALRIQAHGWGENQSDVIRMGLYWLAFTGIDLVCGWIAYRLEPGEKRFPLFLLLAQRVVYRQLMYGVVIRAAVSALRGPWVGWGKLERSGRVGEPAS